MIIGIHVLLDEGFALSNKIKYTSNLLVLVRGLV